MGFILGEGKLDYADFGNRSVAYILDIIFCVLLIWITGSFSGGNKWAVLIIDMFQGMVFFLYTLYFHAKLGQTFGKRMMGVKVVNIDGTPISFSQSLKRNIPWFFASLPYVIATAIAISQIPGDQFHELFRQPKTYYILEASLRPSWYMPIQTIFVIFFFSDLIATFVTSKNQSIHDLIASTIVVHALSVSLVRGNDGDA